MDMISPDESLGEKPDGNPGENPSLSRRKALARLGLGVAVAYTAPTVLRLDRSVHAVQPSCTGKGKGKGNPWCKASEPPESERP